MRRRHRLVSLLATVTLISAALVTLIGLLSEPGTTEAGLGQFLVQLMSVIAAVAVVVGVANLLTVHLGRARQREHGWPYSALVLAAAAAVLVLRALDRAEVWSGDLAGEELSLRVFETVQVSLEAALASLVLFFLVYAAYRLMRRRITPWYVLFAAAVVFVLLGWIPLENAEALADLHDWVVRVPVSAGARGLLIGVGLGTIVVGLRVLLGQERAVRG